jgi:hypothetical protein
MIEIPDISTGSGDSVRRGGVVGVVGVQVSIEVEEAAETADIGINWWIVLSIGVKIPKIQACRPPLGFPIFCSSFCQGVIRLPSWGV